MRQETGQGHLFLHTPCASCEAGPYGRRSCGACASCHERYPVDGRGRNACSCQPWDMHVHEHHPGWKCFSCRPRNMRVHEHDLNAAAVEIKIPLSLPSPIIMSSTTMEHHSSCAPPFQRACPSRLLTNGAPTAAPPFQRAGPPAFTPFVALLQRPQWTRHDASWCSSHISHSLPCDVAFLCQDG